MVRTSEGEEQRFGGRGGRRARWRRKDRGRGHDHTHTRCNEDSKEERPPKVNGWTRRVKISSDFFGSLLHILIKSIIHFRQKAKLPSILPGKWRLAKWLVYHGNLAPPFLLNLKKSCQEIPGNLAHCGVGVNYYCIQIWDDLRSQKEGATRK